MYNTLLHGNCSGNRQRQRTRHAAGFESRGCWTFLFRGCISKERATLTYNYEECVSVDEDTSVCVPLQCPTSSEVVIIVTQHPVYGSHPASLSKLARLSVTVALPTVPRVNDTSCRVRTRAGPRRVWMRSTSSKSNTGRIDHPVFFLALGAWGSTRSPSVRGFTRQCKGRVWSHEAGRFNYGTERYLHDRLEMRSSDHRDT